MNLVLAITGATGAHAAELLAARSPWPVTLVVSRWGKDLCAREGVSLADLAARVDTVLEDTDLSAGISSGSVATVGMVVLPCSANTLGKIASGIADSLITRAAHCHLKQRRELILCVRETPWSLIDLDNARSVAAAGGVIMPICPPYYMVASGPPQDVTMTELLGAYVDRVLALLGRRPDRTWEDLS